MAFLSPGELKSSWSQSGCRSHASSVMFWCGLHSADFCLLTGSYWRTSPLPERLGGAKTPRMMMIKCLQKRRERSKKNLRIKQERVRYHRTVESQSTGGCIEYGGLTTRYRRQSSAGGGTPEVPCTPKLVLMNCMSHNDPVPQMYHSVSQCITMSPEHSVWSLDMPCYRGH